MNVRKIVMMKGNCERWLAVEVDEAEFKTIAKILGSGGPKPSALATSPEEAIVKLDQSIKTLEKAAARVKARRFN